MKKSIVFIIVVLHTVNLLSAQGKKAMPPMPDVKRLMAMTPAQQKQYADSFKNIMGQHVADIADEAGIAVDETVLPGFDMQPPVKDIARLNLIPSRPLTRTELVAQVQKSKAQLESIIPKPQLAEIEKFSARHSADKIHQASIGGFYNNEPEKALLLMMAVATKQPDSLIVWNNLGAMYNQVGMQHRAVPMLKYCLQNESGSSVVLNNLGQSYMGLGDLAYAKHYFVECLGIDSLNPDANHSMGLLYMFEKKFDMAMEHFNRELKVAMRSSTIAYAAKMGKKVNLRELLKQKNALNGRPQKDFFEEINLGKIKIPAFPGTVQEAYAQVPEYVAAGGSIQGEIMFWQQTANQTTIANAISDGKSYFGPYNELVKVLLDELSEEFTPEYLSNIRKKDVEAGQAIINHHAEILRKLECPKPPHGSSIAAQEVYETKCCVAKIPLINQRLDEYGGFWYSKVKVSQQRWKSYINQLIAIVQLDPSPSNQIMVYHAVAAYFSALGSGLLYSGTAEAVNSSLPVCKTKYSAGEQDSILTTDRNWRLGCPAWLNVEVDLEVVKIKTDCSKYGVEVGAGLFAQYEHDFKTGSNTLAAGVGLKAKFFAGIGKASIKQMAYVTFDNNNQFADFGVRGKAEVGIGDSPVKIGRAKVGTTIIGIEGNYQVSINNGFTSNAKGKGVIADFVKIDQSL